MDTRSATKKGEIEMEIEDDGSKKSKKKKRRKNDANKKWRDKRNTCLENGWREVMERREKWLCYRKVQSIRTDTRVSPFAQQANASFGLTYSPFFCYTFAEATKYLSPSRTLSSDLLSDRTSNRTFNFTSLTRVWRVSCDATSFSLSICLCERVLSTRSS